MTDETNAYAVKINGHTFVSMDAAKSIVDEARVDGWNLALEEAAKVMTGHYEALCTEHRLLLVARAAAIRALIKEEP